MHDDPSTCTPTVICAPWRASIGAMLSPTPAVPFGEALDMLVAAGYAATAESAHRAIGVPRVRVRTRETLDTDPTLRALVGPLPMVADAHTWLILTLDRAHALDVSC